MKQNMMKEAKRFLIVLICSAIGGVLVGKGHPIIGFTCAIGGIYSGIEEDKKDDRN